MKERQHWTKLNMRSLNLWIRALGGHCKKRFILLLYLLQMGRDYEEMKCGQGGRV